MIKAVLSIAGSDSGGGAGIQADLKAFARSGVHGMTAITALTAQNTLTVTGIHTTPPEFIIEQVRTVADDIPPDAVKIGMLGTRTTVEAVAEALDRHIGPGTPIVVDPVMVSESGAILLDEDARTAIAELILPRATVITPNLPEARVLAGRDDDDPEVLARALLAMGPTHVVVTGGHRRQATDVLIEQDGTVTLIDGERHPDGAAHGSGCTHSSALAAHLAKGLDVKAAARAAKAIASEAVAHGLRGIGRGPGPVDALDLGAAARGNRATAVA